MNQLGKNLEVYVDVMVAKNISTTSPIRPSRNLYRNNKVQHKAKPEKKIIFGVPGGKFFGFMLTHIRIEANSKKCVTMVSSITMIR